MDCQEERVARRVGWGKGREQDNRHTVCTIDIVKHRGSNADGEDVIATGVSRDEAMGTRRRSSRIGEEADPRD